MFSVSSTPTFSMRNFPGKIRFHATLIPSDDLSIHSNENGRNNDDIKITIDADGSAVTITQIRHHDRPAGSATPSEHHSTFPAWWLWMQDPQGIHSSSGQRQRSLGYTTAKSYVVRAAQIVTAISVASDLANNSKLHPRPPKGSYHSRGNVYSTTNDAEDDHPMGDCAQRLLLQVSWGNDSISYFDLDWLCQFSSLSDHHTTTRITSDLAIGAIENTHAIPIPTLDYHFIMNTPQGQMEALDAIVEHGAILVPRAPILMTPSDSSSDNFTHQAVLPSDQIVASLGKRLSGGRLSHGSLYGETFRVVSQPNAKNIAYTSQALAPHQDLAYYESKPFLQLLQCISHTGQGGASVLIDAMAAAEYLRTVAEDLFNVLCHFEATFVKQRPGADIVSFKPHIRVSSQTGEVIEVTWSPPFEGPPALAPSSGPGHVSLLNEYFRAYQAMECLLDNHATEAGKSVLEPGLQSKLQDYSRRYTWEQVLEPGDILVFNNQRMCHGRRAFMPSKTVGSSMERHLVGCYTDAMETINTCRVLRRAQLGPRGRSRSIGNGTRGSSI